MIPHGEGFIIRHASGRFFRSDAYVPTFPKGGFRPGMDPFATVYRLVESPFVADVVRVREFCGRFFASDPAWALVADQFEVVPRPGCGACGSDYLRHGAATIHSDGEVHRCDRHKGRHVCAIEGCRRTRAADGDPADDAWLCAEHWRAACPPRSAQRRCWLRLHRLARRHGWTPELARRRDRIFAALIRRATRTTAGDIDMAEIERLFGWAA